MIIRVPATSANIGPGYDSMGLAFNLYNDFYFSLADKTDEATKKSLMYKSVDYFFKSYKFKVPELNIRVKGDIPMSRGLGSSASCIVASLVFANEYSGLNLNKKALLKMATEIEGHPDNVAPALLGGHVTSLVRDKEVFYYKSLLSEKLKFILLVPDFKLETKEARKVVKKEVALEDAVLNIAAASLITQALRTGDFALLKGVAEDRLHEPYRKKLIKDYNLIKEEVTRSNGVLFISGAGPSLMAITEEANEGVESSLRSIETQAHWKILNLKIDNRGTYIKE
ncbi:homoserine kinase [Peptoniphilus catoniae]|uniref:homoserine kinase n=1 Tax=Peptoniphilus catoniae TaxID=1660341 RepID=UPI0010FE75D8|nr:homoserine kinase [Peptoniphilus catoniae]